MRETALESLLRRDRVIVAGALALLTVLAWAYLLWLADSMAGMGMPAMGGDPMPGGVMAPGLAMWSPAEFGFMFIMWFVMMIGMMSPSVTPMILIYARVGRQAAAQGKPLAATGVFVAGYLLAWGVFSLAATVCQWALESALLLSPTMSSASARFSGLLLMATGLYQWTPQKDVCLSRCQSPLHFIQQHGGFRRDVPGSLRLGLRHGLYCIGCCWMLMALLFVGGVMNIAWIAAIAIFVLLEKIVPAGRLLSRAAGVALLAAGLWLLAAG
ncbi:DUF2182 domain-containing protein [Chelativorans sp. M5D2P16]|uniref:DUF2182 domain-containing protein n=1 Tax=Chelativorans sp. M5D2P16 TaxID=3095678 RepID=UPI002ACA35C8|nr:DUF2182 domain-containing protein [Chelativorans sp. M5D2P16]MDZ5695842.1 DUF2182 domain-containing protein [Chelativorans sp. M5D2P16]